MNIVAIIPARGNSKGIKNKNIINFCDKPLIYWTIQQSLGSKYINENVYVSSDSEEILNLSNSYGARIIKRPEELSTDNSTSEIALLHAINNIEKTTNIDLVVFLQCTSPLRESGDIDNAIEYFIKNELDSLFSATNMKDLCLWRRFNKELKSINFDYKSRLMRQNIEPQFSENGSFYIFKPDILKKYNNRFGGKIGLYEMDSWKIYEIDDKEDIEICDYFMKTKILTNN
tara:strand:- start:1045 stop:1734 length:690 start_codon:yes stop_codon:yes gene_type:complete